MRVISGGLGGNSTIQQGDEGPDVTTLQQNLTDLGYDDNSSLPVTIDGVFGPQTARAVADFQSRQGLKVDSVVGPDTWAAIANALNGGGVNAGPQATPAQAKALQTAASGGSAGTSLQSKIATALTQQPTGTGAPAWYKKPWVIGLGVLGLLGVGYLLMGPKVRFGDFEDPYPLAEEDDEAPKKRRKR